MHGPWSGISEEKTRCPVSCAQLMAWDPSKSLGVITAGECPVGRLAHIVTAIAAEPEHGYSNPQKLLAEE